jgi:hypothetical protein
MVLNLQSALRWLFVGFLLVVVGTVSAVDVRQLETAKPTQPVAIPASLTGSATAPGDISPKLPLAVELPYAAPEATPMSDPIDAAADALARIGTPAVRRVSMLLQDPNPRVRERGAEILGKIGPEAKSALNELVYLLHDADPGVRVAAANALGNMGVDAADAVPALVEKVAQAPTR